MEADDFQIFLTPGTATLASPPITKVETLNNTNFKLTLALLGPPSGNETLSIYPAENAIYGKAGNPTSTAPSFHSNNYIYLNPDPTAKPDLVLIPSYASFNPASVSQGDTVDLALRGWNRGVSPSPEGVTIRAWLLPTINTGKYEDYVALGETTIDHGIQPNQSIVVRFKGQIPDDLKPGEHHVLFWVDPDKLGGATAGKVDESSETNNWIFQPAGSGRPTYLKVVS